MFLGQHHHSFDTDGRLAVPPSFRESLSGGAYITQGFDRDLLVLSVETFRAVVRRFSELNITDPLARLLLRMILGNASELEMDEGGRILIPSKLRDFAGLKDEAVLVGQGEYLEVWAPASWKEQELQLQDAQANAGRFASLEMLA